MCAWLCRRLAECFRSPQTLSRIILNCKLLEENPLSIHALTYLTENDLVFRANPDYYDDLVSFLHRLKKGDTVHELKLVFRDPTLGNDHTDEKSPSTSEERLRAHLQSLLQVDLQSSVHSANTLQLFQELLKEASVFELHVLLRELSVHRRGVNRGHQTSESVTEHQTTRSPDSLKNLNHIQRLIRVVLANHNRSNVSDKDKDKVKYVAAQLRVHFESLIDVRWSIIVGGWSVVLSVIAAIVFAVIAKRDDLCSTSS